MAAAYVPTTEELVEYDQETWRLISDLEGDLVAAEESEAAAKASYTSKKHAAEELRIELRGLVRDRKASRGKPPEKNLFSEVEKNKAAAGAVPEDLWRQFPIDRLVQFGLEDGDVKKLQAGDVKGGSAHPIATVGDLSDFITPDKNNPSFTRNLVDLKGVGAKAAERISDADVAFWKFWRDGGDVAFAREKGVLPAAEETTAEAPAEAAPEPTAEVATDAAESGATAGG
jgi:hypothetical protein